VSRPAGPDKNNRAVVTSAATPGIRREGRSIWPPWDKQGQEDDYDHHKNHKDENRVGRWPRRGKVGFTSRTVYIPAGAESAYIVFVLISRPNKRVDTGLDGWRPGFWPTHQTHTYTYLHTRLWITLGRGCGELRVYGPVRDRRLAKHRYYMYIGIYIYILTFVATVVGTFIHVYVCIWYSLPGKRYNTVARNIYNIQKYYIVIAVLTPTIGLGDEARLYNRVIVGCG